MGYQHPIVIRRLRLSAVATAALALSLVGCASTNDAESSGSEIDSGERVGEDGALMPSRLIATVVSTADLNESSEEAIVVEISLDNATILGESNILLVIEPSELTCGDETSASSDQIRPGDQIEFRTETEEVLTSDPLRIGIEAATITCT